MQCKQLSSKFELWLLCPFSDGNYYNTNASLSIYICVCVCVCMYMNVYINLYICISVLYIYIYISTPTHTCTRIGWKVHWMMKILSWNVTKWSLFFHIVLLVINTLFPSVLQRLDLISKKIIHSRHDILNCHLSNAPSKHSIQIWQKLFIHSLLAVSNI